MRSQRLENVFPGLVNTTYEITSPTTFNYNCIAWAADDVVAGRVLLAGRNALGRYHRDIHPDVLRMPRGYEKSDSGEFEVGYEKLAIYAVGGRAKHMARQLADGRWTSKLGSERDISHELTGLEGTAYGDVVQFLRRKLSAPDPA
jgi:hypothetical protein